MYTNIFTVLCKDVDLESLKYVHRSPTMTSAALIELTINKVKYRIQDR